MRRNLLHSLSPCAHVGRRAAHRGAECAAAARRGGLSQAKLAERMGVDRAYVSGLESGERNPTIVTLWHVAQALGVRIAVFFEEKVRTAVARDRR